MNNLAMHTFIKSIVVTFLIFLPTNAYAAPNDAPTDNKVTMVADQKGINPELLDKSGFPVKEVANKAEMVSVKLALDLLKAKMINQVFIDTRSKTMLLVSQGGAVMLTTYEPDPKLLNKFFENKLTPVFGEFL